MQPRRNCHTLPTVSRVLERLALRGHVADGEWRLKEDVVKGRVFSFRAFVWAAIAYCALAGQAMVAQQPAPVPELPVPVNQSDDPLLAPFVWRSIGPAVMGGRVDDIAVHESDLSTI